jgi:hypothetical protein
LGCGGSQHSCEYEKGERVHFISLACTGLSGLLEPLGVEDERSRVLHKFSDTSICNTAPTERSKKRECTNVRRVLRRGWRQTARSRVFALQARSASNPAASSQRPADQRIGTKCKPSKPRAMEPITAFQGDRRWCSANDRRMQCGGRSLCCRRSNSHQDG